MKYLLITLLTLSLSYSAVSQNRAPSPAATVEQRVGLTDVSVVYSRPSMKGRTIFAADGLVPYGKMWRTGANYATKVTFSDDVEVNGAAVAKGSYAILTIPTVSSWTVNLYPYEGSGWSSYKEATPTATVQTESSALGVSVESFLIAFDQLKDNSALMYLMWDKTAAALEIKVK
jgi:hypothetical protein